jgi:hypothetical protein
VFGGLFTPGAFQPVTPCILHEVRAKTRGGAHIYVDDLAGVCMKRDVKGEVKSANHVTTDLLGDHSEQEEKNVVVRHC